MALIKCIECGKEISDKAIACTKCGCPVSETIKNMNVHKIEKESIVSDEPTTIQIEKTEQQKDTSFDRVTARCKSVPKTKIIIVGCILVLIAILGLINRPSQNEKRAIECVKELKALSIKPESLEIMGNVLVHDLEWTEDEGDYIVVLRFADGYDGERFSDVAFYSDLGFVDYRGYQKTDDKYIREAKELRTRDAFICEDLWSDYGDEYFADPEKHVEIISGKYVAQKTGCAFIE